MQHTNKVLNSVFMEVMLRFDALFCISLKIRYVSAKKLSEAVTFDCNFGRDPEPERHS